MKRSFTLIELLIVLVIIGILAALAVPQYKLIVIHARGAEAMTNIRALSDSLWRYYTEAGEFPGQVTLPIGRIAPSPALDTTLPTQDTKYFHYDYIGSPLAGGWEAYDVDAAMNGPIGSIIKYSEFYQDDPDFEGIMQGKPMGDTKYYKFRYHLVKRTMGGGTPLPLVVPGWPGEKW